MDDVEENVEFEGANVGHVNFFRGEMIRFSTTSHPFLPALGDIHHIFALGMEGAEGSFPL